MYTPFSEVHLAEAIDVLGVDDVRLREEPEYNINCNLVYIYIYI